MKLSQLFPQLELSQMMQDLKVTGLSSDSRYAEKGDLFFALQGTEQHGLDYFDALLNKEVAVIFYEGNYPTDKLEAMIPMVKVDNLHVVMRAAAQLFYKKSLQSAKLLGITGTEGKTSVAMYTAKALAKLNYHVGIIGTNGIGAINNLKENTHTTPDYLALYRSIDEIVRAYPINEDIYIVLEVTSHALDQERIHGLKFEVSTFLNLARDHLDYHQTVEAYQKAKERLFEDYRSHYSIINISDPVGLDIFNRLDEQTDRILYPFGEIEHDHINYLKISDIELHSAGINFKLTFHNKTYVIFSPLYGHFNAYNLVAMVGNLLGIGVEINDIINLLPTTQLVKGRMEALQLPNGAVSIIDYAHKPNALLQVLKALRKHIPKGSLYCIFGCGGDRDRGKRPLMAEIAEQHSDYVIVTNDNPRTEDENSIVDEIFAGFKGSGMNIEKILNRKEAIIQTLAKINEGDIVLIAGKGHEDYQIIGHTKHHFSDAEIVSEYIQKGK